jgi:hypothetical protein
MNTENLKTLLETKTPLTEKEILSNLPTEKIPAWESFMRGKTVPRLPNGDHGVYSWDLSQFLNLLENKKL